MRELIEGLEGIVRQIDQLARTVAGGIGGRAEEMGEELTKTLRSARERLQEVERDLQHAVKGTARATDRYVRDNPWPAIAMAAAAAFVIGALLVSRRAPSPEPHSPKQTD